MYVIDAIKIENALPEQQSIFYFMKLNILIQHYFRYRQSRGN